MDASGSAVDVGATEAATGALTGIEDNTTGVELTGVDDNTTGVEITTDNDDTQGFDG